MPPSPPAANCPPGTSRLPVMAAIRQMAEMVEVPSLVWSPMPLPILMNMGWVVPMSRATSRICSAGRPVMGAAHSGGNCRTCSASLSKPWHHSATKSASYSRSPMSTFRKASASAQSVPGRTGSHMSALAPMGSSMGRMSIIFAAVRERVQDGPGRALVHAGVLRVRAPVDDEPGLLPVVRRHAEVADGHPRRGHARAWRRWRCAGSWGCRRRSGTGGPGCRAPASTRARARRRPPARTSALVSLSLSAMVSRASSQVMRWNLPSPLAPARFRGYCRRSAA